MAGVVRMRVWAGGGPLCPGRSEVEREGRGGEERRSACRSLTGTRGAQVQERVRDVFPTGTHRAPSPTALPANASHINLPRATPAGTGPLGVSGRGSRAGGGLPRAQPACLTQRAGWPGSSHCPGHPGDLSGQFAHTCHIGIECLIPHTYHPGDGFMQTRVGKREPQKEV